MAVRLGKVEEKAPVGLDAGDVDDELRGRGLEVDALGVGKRHAEPLEGAGEEVTGLSVVENGLAEKFGDARFVGLGGGEALEGGDEGGDELVGADHADGALVVAGDGEEAARGGGVAGRGVGGEGVVVGDRGEVHLILLVKKGEIVWNEGVFSSESV